MSFALGWFLGIAYAVLMGGGIGLVIGAAIGVAIVAAVEHCFPADRW